MSKYLIVTDLDGTLLNKKSRISAASRRYIRKIVNQGHIFVICSGRPFQGAINYYNYLGIDSPIICDNGGSIHFPNDHSKDIFATIPLETFINFTKKIRHCIHCAMGSTFKSIYFYNRKDVPDFIQHLNPPRDIYEGYLDEIVKEDMINPSLFIKEEYEKDFLDTLKEDEFKSIKYRYWGKYNGICSYELFNENCTKGHAVDTLKKILKIEHEHDLVFGDEMNDLELIKHGYNSVVMVNGNPELRKYAKYISVKPNYQNGEVHFIKKFFKENNIRRAKK